VRGVGARLALGLAVVVAGALGIVYVVVVPSLEGRLVDSKVSALRAEGPRLARSLPSDRQTWAEFVESASFRSGARVTVFVNGPGRGRAPAVVADSRGTTSADLQRDPLVVQAAVSGRLASGAVEREGVRFAEVAVPARGGEAVVFLSRSLADSLATVSLLERRLVLAGGVALAVAIAAGYGAARLFARRIRRLERAAHRIAGGDFGEPVLDAGPDEVGQLAGAVEEMRRRLLRLDEARREFVANPSHELRTPVFALSGALELLDEEELEEGERREFIRSMREQVERLTKLTAELLDLSRLDAGRMRVDRDLVDLAAVGAGQVEEFAPVARRFGHRLEWTGAGVVSVVGDEERIRQIGRSLVENALRHTPEGTEVRVRAGAGRAGELVVEDDGPGIAVEHGGHIFERFYRVEGGRASGSGLGLAIAAELASLMGGSLALEAVSGRTVFVLRLPRAAGAPGADRVGPV
jgi:signal transduction histidine kinase